MFRIKPATKTEPDRYKARLVAKGFLQRSVIDYGDTYAPVASFDSIRIMFWLITYLNMQVLQFNVKTAFLNGVLKEKIFMSPPEGFDFNGKVCRLITSMYGLKTVSEVLEPDV